MSRLWRSLEFLPGLAAVEAEWKALLDDDYTLVRKAFLVDSGKFASSYPCPHECGCTHQVVRYSDGSIVAVCRCEPSSCDDIHLRAEDTAIFQFDMSKFGRAIRKALGFHTREDDPGIFNTFQIAAYTDQSYPVFLTIQYERQSFKQVVAEIAAKIQGRFILLSPTADFSDSTCQSILAGTKSLMLPLETSLRMAQSGDFQIIGKREDLFAAFKIEQVAPQSDDELARVMHMVKVMDDEGAIKKLSLMTVFRCYCEEGLSAEKIARKCKCSKGTVINRKRQLEAKLGSKLESLRNISDHFEKIDGDLSDPRAEHIHRKNALR